MVHFVWIPGGPFINRNAQFGPRLTRAFDRWMFDCSRVPGLDGKDFSITSAKPGDTGENGHVVFLRKGRVWKVDAAVDGRLLTTSELEKLVPLTVFTEKKPTHDLCRQIEHIYSQTTVDFPPVGVLTANNRDVWAKVRVIRLDRRGGYSIFVLFRITRCYQSLNVINPYWRRSNQVPLSFVWTLRLPRAL